MPPRHARQGVSHEHFHEVPGRLEQGSVQATQNVLCLGKRVQALGALARLARGHGVFHGGDKRVDGQHDKARHSAVNLAQGE